MENNDIIKQIQDKINKINNEANSSLDKLNQKEGERFKNINSMYDCDVDYYANVARYAWAARAKLIAMMEMQSLLNKIKTELNGQIQDI